MIVLGACSPSEQGFKVPPLRQPAATEPVPQVRVDLVQGPALPMAKLLSASVAKGLNDQGVIAMVGGQDPVAYVLSGRAEANWDTNQGPFVMLIYWTLTDTTGNQVGIYTQGVRGARWKWDYGDPRIIRAVGSGAAKPVSTMIVGEQKTTLPFLLIGAGILVKPVTGSPGGQDAVLTAAMKSALAEADVLITEDSRQASLILNGTVSIAASGQGLADVTIIWRVGTLDDFEVGRAIQENTLGAAGLSESWPTEAPKIAAAALDGIERILRTGNSRTSPGIPK